MRLLLQSDMELLFLKQMGVAHGNQEVKVKAVIGIAHNEEQGGFFVPQGVVPAHHRL